MLLEFTTSDGRRTYINSDRITQVTESQNKLPYGSNGNYVYTYISMAGEEEAVAVREPIEKVVNALNHART